MLGRAACRKAVPRTDRCGGLEAAHAAMVAAVEEGRYDAPAEGGGASC